MTIRERIEKSFKIIKFLPKDENIYDGHAVTVIEYNNMLFQIDIIDNLIIDICLMHNFEYLDSEKYEISFKIIKTWNKI